MSCLAELSMKKVLTFITLGLAYMLQVLNEPDL